MKSKYLALLSVLGIIAIGIAVSAISGILPVSDVPFAFGVLVVFGALLLVYTSLRVRDE